MGVLLQRAAAIAALATGLTAFAGEAAAQSGQAAVRAASYGYGAAQPAPAARAVLDLRRSAPPSAEALAAAPDDLETDEDFAVDKSARGARAPEETVEGYEETGIASWYGDAFRGRATANGERFDPNALTAAHPRLPMPSLVQVTNLDNGRSVVLRVNDRGPHVRGRILDVSERAAQDLDFHRAGEARVQVRYLGPAPRLLMAAQEEEDGAPMSLLPPQTETPAQARTVYTPPAAPAPMVQRASFPAPGFVVQIGAYGMVENAHRAQAAAQGAGSVHIEAARVNGREIFRVRLGPWVDREAAEAARARVARLGFTDAIVAPR